MACGSARGGFGRAAPSARNDRPDGFAAVAANLSDALTGEVLVSAHRANGLPPMRLPAMADGAETTSLMDTRLAAHFSRMAGQLLTVAVALSLCGCGVAHMALPQDLQSETSALSVEGRYLLIFNDSLEFGPYRVTDIDRGWTTSEGYSLSIGEFEFGGSESHQSYAFSMAEPDRPGRHVECTTTSDMSDMETDGFLGGRFGVEFSSDQHLLCTLTQDGGGNPARLAMARSASAGDTALHGVLADGDTRIDISGTHRLDATSLRSGSPSGYIFEMDGRPVGAVEVINGGTVWLNDSLTPEARSAMAAASAVLLLYQDATEIPEEIQRM